MKLAPEMLLIGGVVSFTIFTASQNVGIIIRGILLYLFSFKFIFFQQLR